MNTFVRADPNPLSNQQDGKINIEMARRTKLEFEPLTLEETARRLGVPHRRAERILTLVGVKAEAKTRRRMAKHRANNAKSARTTKS